MVIQNLGFVKSISSGLNPPQNTKMLWYDENVNRHKYYNTISSTWDLLGPPLTKTNLIDSTMFDSDLNLIINHNLNSRNILISIQSLDRTSGRIIPYKAIDNNSAIVYTGELITGYYGVLIF